MIAAGLAWSVLALERSRVDADFEASAREHAMALERGWSSEFYAIEHLATIFRTSEKVTRDEFARASDTILRRHAGVRALEWVPKVLHAERAGFVANARRTMPGYDFVDLGPDGELRPIERREVYFPIHYIEPLDPNRRALGFDPAGNEARNAALHAAVNSGSLAVSVPTPVVQDEPASKALLVFVPVYDHGGDLSSPSGRRRALQGLAEGVYMVDALVSHAMAAVDSQGIGVVVHALEDGERQLISRYAERGGSGFPWYVWSHPGSLQWEWSVGNRTFLSTVHARGLPYGYDLRAPLAVLALGLLLTVAIAGVVGLLMQRERRSRTLAELRHDQLHHQAAHDALTGLVNRGAFEMALADALEEGSRRAAVFSLCYLDLDEFKVVNDIHGYQAGDDLLRQIVERLAAHMRKGDVFARLGGDEFAVLLQDTRTDQARTIAEEYLSLINGYRFRSGDRIMAVSVSIGITEIASATSTVGTALGEADAACHIAKELGRNRIHVFHSGDTVSDRYRSQMVWATEVRQALDDDRLVLYGQRIVPSDPASGEGWMLEVLVRLRDRQGGIVSPGEFIPAAERYNLMAEVDRWVIARALALKAARGDRDIWCINLSGHSIGEQGMFDFIRRTLRDHGVSPRGLCFEITETAVVRSLSRAERFISRLRELGCLVALDDFGSGMSSFVYLKHLPVDFLKIDGGFVRSIQDSRMDRAMVHAIQQIAVELGIRTIAEYVETATARSEVRALGVDFVQGFHIGKPAPIEGIANHVLPALRARV